MGRIFISYRRTDSADQAGRVFDRLVTAFSKQNVFKDVDSVPAGADFRRVIEVAVMKSETFVLVIGPSWLNAANEAGKRRLDDQNDFVRMELECALRLGKLIIPVLVRGGAMPVPNDLPDTIREVAFRHAVSVRPDPDFHRDMDRLIQAIKARKAEKYQAKPANPTITPKQAIYAASGFIAFLICLFLFVFSLNQPKPTEPVKPPESTQTASKSEPPTNTGPPLVPVPNTGALPFPVPPSKTLPTTSASNTPDVGPQRVPDPEIAQSGPTRPSPQYAPAPITLPPGVTAPTEPPSAPTEAPPSPPKADN